MLVPSTWPIIYGEIDHSFTTPASMTGRCGAPMGSDRADDQHMPDAKPWRVYVDTTASRKSGHTVGRLQPPAGTMFTTQAWQTSAQTNLSDSRVRERSQVTKANCSRSGTTCGGASLTPTRDEKILCMFATTKRDSFRSLVGIGISVFLAPLRRSAQQKACL